MLAMLPFINIQINVYHFELFQKGETSLHTACEHSHTSVVSLLLKEGADVNIKNKVSNI